MDYEDIQFTLDVSFDEGFLPLKGSVKAPTEWEGEALETCSLIVTSKKGERELVHYFSGLALRAEEGSMLEDLEYYLDDEGLMDKILKVWQLEEENQGPSWKK